MLFRKLLLRRAQALTDDGGVRPGFALQLNLKLNELFDLIACALLAEVCAVRAAEPTRRSEKLLHRLYLRRCADADGLVHALKLEELTLTRKQRRMQLELRV